MERPLSYHTSRTLQKKKPQALPADRKIISMLETFIRNAAQTYEHEQFGKIRVIEKEGNTWFIAKDICAALGLAQVSRAIQKLDEDEVTSSKVIDSLGREQTANAISESGMYSLVLVSRKPEAKAFKRWVTHEVLPSIRKHGGYLTPEKVEEALTDPDTIIRLATNLKEERAKRQELEAENRELAPKALFADAVAASDNTMLVGELAKLLASNGINIGQNRLFAWLRGNGYLMKDGSWKNMPTQRSMDMGLFVVKETAIAHADGHVTLSRTPKVTGKGQRYFVGRFLDSSEAAFDCSIRKMLDNERKG